VFAYDIKEYIKKTHSFQQNIESFWKANSWNCWDNMDITYTVA
jgi:hypothetical protein